MRLRNVPGARETIIENQFSIQQPEQMKGKWAEVFKNDHPIHIEVGMGKGQFIIEMARRNPEVNYIGIEKYSSVLVRAVEKLEDFEQDNLRLIRMDAENIEEVFDKDEVDRIYLNFSDPWPKDRHAKRRLTSTRFLERYDNILTPAMTHLTFNALMISGACSLEEPHPKFLLATIISPGCTLFTNSGSISAIAWLASSCASNEFRYLAGMITSVSTLSPYLKTCPKAFIICHLLSLG